MPAQSSLDLLIELARERLGDDLSKGEIGVLRSSARFGPTDEADEIIEDVRPEFVRWLVTDPKATPHLDSRGLQVGWVRFSTKLDLTYSTCSFPLTFFNSSFAAGIDLDQSSLRHLQISDSQIAGGFSMSFASCAGPILFQDVEIDGQLLLTGTTVGHLVLSDVNIHSHEHSLSLDLATVNGLCQLTPNFRATGAVTLAGAKIYGHLATQGAQFLGDKNSFSADAMQLAGRMICDGSFFWADCSVRHARVKGYCSFSHTQFGDQGFGGKLSLLGTTIGGNMYLSGGLFTRGEIELSQVRVEGNLSCHGLYVSVLQGTRLTVLGDLDWRSVHVYEEGWLILDNAAIGCLRDDEFSWPGTGHLRLHRAKIGKLLLHQVAPFSKKEDWTEELPFSVEKRIRWLNLQENKKSLDSFSWIQVAEMLKATGDAAGARNVVLAYRRHEAYAEYLANWPSFGGFIPPDLNRRVFLAKRWLRIRAEIFRAALVWRLRRLLAIFEWEPFLILAVIVAFTLLGTVVFWPMEGRFAPTSTDAYKASMTPVAKRGAVAPYPQFSPFIYSLENVLPVIRLGQDDKWAPNPEASSRAVYWLLCSFRWFLILVGWSQATILATVISERFLNRK